MPEEIVATAQLETFSAKKTLVFNIQNFEALRDKRHKTPSVGCLGHQWSLMIYPFGSSRAKDDDPVTIGYRNIFAGFFIIDSVTSPTSPAE